MTGNDLRLYLKLIPPSSFHTFVGQIGFQRLYTDNAQAAGCVCMGLEFKADIQFGKNGPSQWAWFQADAWNQRVPPRRFGDIEIDVESRPPFGNPYPAPLTWRWRLQPEDIELIEVTRDPKAQEVNFAVRATGIVQVANSIFTVAGSGNIAVLVSEWLGLLKQLGYGLPPSDASLVSVASTMHPTWKMAEEQLAEARKHLAQGEDYQALTACLDRFSAIVGKPYTKEAWLAVLPDDPDQKRDSLAGWLAAHCTYLNRVGYHRDHARAPEAQGLERMPLDHWEAELAASTSHFLLALALRMKARQG
jgi:hypothetical protein